MAQAALEREAALKALRQDLCRSGIAIEGARAAGRDGNRARPRLARGMEAARADCWLGEADAVPTVATVRETLAAVADLGPALERRALLLDRIEKMRADQAAFAAQVAAAAQSLDCPADTAAPLELEQMIARRVQAARSALDERTRRTQELEGAQQRQRQLGEARDLNARRSREMQDHFAVQFTGRRGRQAI